MTVDKDHTDDAALALAQTLCARLCHDLGGPAGMAASMLETAAAELVPAGGGQGRPDGPVLDEALAIARDGAVAVRARLRVWRAACGGDTGPLDAAALAALVTAMLVDTRVTFDCAMPPDTILPPAAVQLALVATMLGVEALPRGGIVHLAGGPDEILVLPQGVGARWPAGLSAAVAGMAVELEPRRVLPAFLAALAAAEGWRLGIGLGPSTMPGPLMITWPD
ncbi:histidine phosphotransferase family protein [Humitalea sp. 24SJ18S-53]|uniref:histidine phosphotransferase family protein n=1 Tax=Humitalea sp. 24SJ18S-53 TaxID=3422307 RepID=UPI003D6669D6